MKKNDVVIILLGVLSVLVIINLIVGFYGGGIRNVTGSVVEETSVDRDLIDEIIELREENDELREDKEEISKRVEELESKLKEIEEEQSIKKEVCPISCGKDEICVPVNKADGSVNWQCINDPETVIGAT